MAKLGRAKRERKERRIGATPRDGTWMARPSLRRKLSGFGLVTGLYTPSGFIGRQEHFRCGNGFLVQERAFGCFRPERRKVRELNCTEIVHFHLGQSAFLCRLEIELLLRAKELGQLLIFHRTVD